VIRIDDILAALIMSLAMMRRLDVLATTYEHNSHVRQSDFEQWRAEALRAYNTTALACLGKVVLSVLWFYFVQQTPALQIGGFLLFAAWIVLLVHAWRGATEAAALKKWLKIERRRPGVEREDR